MKSDKELKHKKEDAQKILVLIADKVKDKQFTTNYPICPICKSRIRHFGDNDRVSIRELIFATWIDFENLTLEEKFNRTKQVVASKT